MVNWRRRIRGSPRQIGRPFKVESSSFDIGYGKSGDDQARSTTQALKQIAERKIIVQGSNQLQEEYSRVNNEFFKGKLPSVTIMLANLPFVEHRAFAVRDAKIIVINTDKSKELDEQKADLRHEMIHMAGIKGHGFLFAVYAKAINAPVAMLEGRSIYDDEYQKLLIARQVKREEAHLKEREQRYGAKKGEGTRVVDGKEVARVLGWIRGDKFTMPTTSVQGVPKSATEVQLVLFDKIGYPKKETKVVSRSELERYHIVS